ncbi:MAG: ribosome biogenesis GTP-binding protein YihA/YsxC [Bacteroidales bacterium]|nr:ribosome biogenesis GTP-binding protein YihA/YsxC [Bacteroidales bacterium]TFH46355.1 MAG: YihA family ribosome biogenesis GTP-binding protein [Bacteroidia bacterium]
MIIKSALYVTSSARISQCPPPDMPEYAFIGRSNVGKSSLINMLVTRKGLAKISGTPGKTRTINHFIINDSWYLVDLPGYGYAKASQKLREEWSRLITTYITKRENLVSLFVLIDARHEPIASDLEFMERLAVSGVPFVRVFTKADKAGQRKVDKNLALYNKVMLEKWESLPVTFVTSATKGKGREEILDYISETMIFFKKEE